MNISDYYAYLDHTNLKQDAPWEDIQKLCEEAQEYGCASVVCNRLISNASAKPFRI